MYDQNVILIKNTKTKDVSSTSKKQKHFITYLPTVSDHCSSIVLTVIVFLILVSLFVSFQSKYPQYDSQPLQRRLICYYTFSSPNDTNVLNPDRIDPLLCTHLIVGFAYVSNNSLHLTEHQLGVFNATTLLKVKNPNLKVLVSIGGAGGNIGFPEMVVDHQHRKEYVTTLKDYNFCSFIKSVDEFVRAYKCDGIDLDWEFPSSDSKQRMHFTQLLYELRKEINRQHRHKFIVSVAVAAQQVVVDLSYDVAYMNDYVDFVNIMTYDFHFYTTLTPITGLNAPLYPASRDFFNGFNTDFSLKYWMERGMDKGKINVGLPTYGHTFELFNENNNKLGAPAKGYGRLGTNGFADYNQICSFLRDGVNVVFDYASRSPYAWKGAEWVSFDDGTSLSIKAQYVYDNGFGGAMVYSLNADDYNGSCVVLRLVMTALVGCAVLLGGGCGRCDFWPCELSVVARGWATGWFAVVAER
ncbi:hypothetical protein FQR65_LT08012 [Abscondita terminalis]|nr:hypothetical protein FQR65_LT08012 [Abscondita terminalis]